MRLVAVGVPVVVGGVVGQSVDRSREREGDMYTQTHAHAHTYIHDTIVRLEVTDRSLHASRRCFVTAVLCFALDATHVAHTTIASPAPMRNAPPSTNAAKRGGVSQSAPKSASLDADGAGAVGSGLILMRSPTIISDERSALSSRTASVRYSSTATFPPDARLYAMNVYVRHPGPAVALATAARV